ncbi:hypothetical protein PO878_13640 [Iamia majanohamensis]|uniref:Uncharacterized protein n=1 Tax=Iamia majanohamensis TaxID=467976 RepID=A0AAF0BQX3_9ACTN|nr:hypothetical protein [Iamia majanohamensis]WCO65541.1 hypothetical protein PO878_13640 [Iamia majanohamensis]
MGPSGEVGGDRGRAPTGPDGAADGEDPRHRRRRRLLVGLGCGLPSLAGTAVVVVVVASLASLSLSLEGCEVRPGDIDLGANAGKGRRSVDLPIEVGPRTDLVDGQAVFVRSDAFPPHRVVAVGVCLREAEEPLDPGAPRPDRGVLPAPLNGLDACDTDTGARFATDARGVLAAAIPVPRVITVQGTAHDCASSPERCLVVAGLSTDFDQSGAEPVSFAPPTTPADLTPGRPRPRTLALPATATTPTTGSPGTEVTVTVTGLVPGEPVLVATCTADFLGSDPWDVCQTDATSAAFAAIALGSVADVPDRADAAGRITATAPIPAHIQPAFSGPSLPCGPDDPCGIVVASAADTTRSAYVPVTVVR